MRNLVAFALLLALSGHAQTFNRNYGRPYPNEEWTAARSIQYGDTLYTLYRRFRYNITPILSQLIFQAENINGDTLFTQTIEDAENPHVPYGFEKDPNTHELIGGGFRQTTGNVLADSGGFLVRYNSLGNPLWNKVYANSDPYYNVQLSTMLSVDDQSNIAQVGYVRHDTLIPWNHTPTDVYLMKVDQWGGRFWDGNYGDPALNETPTDLVRLPDGGYIVQGYTYFTGDLTPPYYHLGSFLLRVDSLGAQQWLTYLPGTNLSLSNIASTIDGNYILGGTKCNATIDSCAAALVKIDENGNILWQRELWPDSTHAGISVLDDVVELADGAFVGGGRNRPSVSGQDAGLVMKTDENGYQLWNRIIDKTPNYDTFSRITSLSDGGILLTGTMARDQLSDVWLVKIDSLGCDSAGCPLDIHTGITPVVTSGEVENHALAAQPNPFTNTTLITFPPLEAGGELVVRDALGRVVLRKRPSAGSTSVEITLRSEPPGLYIASLACTGHQPRSVRLMHEP